LRKTLLDHFRDQLFDLREDLRSYFVSNGLGLDHPMYRSGRDLLNNHIRFTECYSLLGYAFYIRGLRNSPTLMEHFRREFLQRLSCKDPLVTTKLNHIRGKATVVLMHYMFFTSTVGVLLFVAIFPFSFVKNFILVWRARKNSLVHPPGAYTTTTSARATRLSFRRVVVSSLLDKFSSQEELEEASTFAGRHNACSPATA
jgi:hypothetical protein